MIEYHKIEPPFIREDGTKKLIEGKFKNETLEFLKDLKWQFTEKIDGTNISIVWDGHKVEFHGRTERAQIPAHLVNKLNDLFGGQVNEEMILYGEGYGYKIQNGGAYRDDVSFILFDVYQPTTDVWLKREAVESIANQLGIEVVPIILEGTIDDAVQFVKTEPQSTIGKAKMEGVVGRPYIELKDRMGKRVITKIKVFDFVR